MAAYIIGEIEITDRIGYEEYRKVVAATIAQYGGRHLVHGGAAIESLEGDWQPPRIVLLEFPSLEQAKRWYESEEYRGPKAIRHRTATTKAILVEGS